MNPITYGKSKLIVPEYEVKEIERLYNSGMGIKTIVRNYSYSDKKVRAVVKQLGIVKKQGLRELTPQETTEIVEKYKNGKTFVQLAEEYNCSYGTIRSHLIKLGAFTPKKQESIRGQQLENFQELIENHIATRYAKPTLTQPTMIKCSDGRTYCDVTTPLMQAWEYGCSLKIKRR